MGSPDKHLKGTEGKGEPSRQGRELLRNRQTLTRDTKPHAKKEEEALSPSTLLARKELTC